MNSNHPVHAGLLPDSQSSSRQVEDQLHDPLIESCLHCLEEAGRKPFFCRHMRRDCPGRMTAKLSVPLSRPSRLGFRRACTSASWAMSCACDPRMAPTTNASCTAESNGVVSEHQRPLATVVIGGLVSSTLLTLIVLPTLYLWLGSATIGGDTDQHGSAELTNGANIQ